jgi:hypothetical protein
MTELALHFTHAAAQVLWFGALVALAAFAVERMLTHTAAGRHAVYLFGLLLTMLFLPIAFFMAPVKVDRPALPPMEVPGKSVIAPATAGVEPIGIAEATAPLHQEGAVEAGESVIAEPVLSLRMSEPGDRWTRIAPWVAGGYLVGLFGMVLRMVCAFAGSARLRRRSDPVDAGLWIEALRRMGDAINVRIRPVMKWSREVAAPVVIGSVKPVILLPIALASRLSPALVEAVLAHELAHLRRGDIWALAVQRVVETILFFHPAVWWMSRRMETAREEACDDLVLAAGCDPADYAEALVICSECRLEQKGTVMKFASQLAATGNGREHLRRRVLRLIGGGDGGAIRLGWAGWMLGLLLVGGAALSVAAGSGKRADLADLFDGLKAPTKVPADLDGFGIAVADAVVGVIQAQNLPFLGNQRLQEVHAELAALVQTHCRHDLSDGRKRAILSAIRDNGAKHLLLDRHRPGDLGSLNQAYLEFPDRIKTLEWKVFMAITRPPLARDELARLESQRQWIRDRIAGLPDHLPVSRKDVLVNLQTHFDDPLSTPFDRAMNEEQFARFRSAITTRMREAQAGVEEHTPTSARSIKPHNPLPFVLNHLVAEALRTQYMGEIYENLFPLFDDDPVGSSGARNGYIHLEFMSNRMFRGDTRGLHQMEEKYWVIDATTGLPVSVPFDQLEPAKFARWIEAQDKGDFGLSREAGNDLIAVRGAKLALLNVTNWIEADAIRNDELRAVIEQQHKRRIGLSSYYEAHRNEHSTYPPTEFIRPYIGVMTKEGRLAVVHIEDFSGREQILYRVRPRG